MIGIEYLKLEDITMMFRTLEISPVCGAGLVNSAVNRPRSSAFGEDAHATISLKPTFNSRPRIPSSAG